MPAKHQPDLIYLRYVPLWKVHVFTVVQPPRHGTIERTNNGQHYRQTSSFSMDDVYQNRISYNHDGSNSLKDRFTFTVADGTNLLFMVEEAGKEVCVPHVCLKWHLKRCV